MAGNRGVTALASRGWNMTTTQDETIAELQRTVAELQDRLDAARAERDAALAQRNSEFGERIGQQAATIDVLKVMSSTPDDTQPVFELITERAQDLCNGENAGLYELVGGLVHLRAVHSLDGDPATIAAWKANFPIVPTPSVAACRAILEQRVIHFRDTETEPNLHHAIKGLGVRSILAQPLMREGKAIGSIALNHKEPGGFSDSQVALLQTFAEQAVIAITSAETYRALQTRTADLQESLEYRTATSDVLKVISQSTFDLQPVLDMVAETAVRLCAADQAAIFRREGELLRMVANRGFPPEFQVAAGALGAFPIDHNPVTVGTRAMREGRPVHIHDVATVPGYATIPITLGKQRTSLGMPLLREGEVIGLITLARQRVEPFRERQIELVSTFADQAVALEELIASPEVIADWRDQDAIEARAG